MAVYIYCRVSNPSSADSGLSESQQIRTCMSYYTELLVNQDLGTARFPDDLPSGVFMDRGISAWKYPLGERPAGALLIDQLKPGDHVIFLNISRANRNVKHFRDLMLHFGNMEVTPHFVEERINLSTANGQLMANILASVAEHYAALISERCREAKAIAKRHGAEPSRERTKWAESRVKATTREQPEAVIPGVIRMYLRCSHEDQELSGLGMDVQANGVKRYADHLAKTQAGLTVHEEFYADPSVSAFKIDFEKRPMGKKMLDECKAGDHIVIYRADRAFRNGPDAVNALVKLKNRGISVHLVDCGVDTSTPYGELWVSIMSMLAELESKMKSVRAKEIRGYLQSVGRPAGTTPFYAKVVRRDGKSYLDYDIMKMRDLCVSHILRTLGYNTSVVSDVLHAHWASKNKRLPQILSWRKAYNERCMRMYPGYFDEMVENAPAELITKAMEKAIDLLKKPIKERYLRFCRVPLPMDRIEDRLISSGISV